VTDDRLHVLVVDDSAVVRETVSALLSRDRTMVVTVAADPLIAMDKMRRARPDVILLDLEMPRMDGITFLRKLMSEAPLPVVVCSGLTGRGTDAALSALAEGAVAVIAKARLGVRNFLESSAAELKQTLREAARTRPRRPAAGAHRTVEKRLGLTVTTDKVIAIGASTGGTEAVRVVLEALPPDAPGVVVVQHMPEAFTGAFARRLNQSCGVDVREAAHGDRLCEGRVLVAPGNRHLEVRRNGGHYVVGLDDGAPTSGHRPSVDVLFRSVARSAAANAVGVLLTGMGADGADGLLEMRLAGAFTIAQDEATSVVFGMPKEAIARNAVDEVLPLERIGSQMLRRIRRQ